MSATSQPPGISLWYLQDDDRPAASVKTLKRTEINQVARVIFLEMLTVLLHEDGYFRPGKVKTSQPRSTRDGTPRTSIHCMYMDVIQVMRL